MKNLRKLLTTITVLGFTTVSTINVVACNESTFNNFQLVSDWNENNGEVHDLLNVNGTIYAGTVFSWDSVKGDLYKSSTNGKDFNKLSSWNENNGIVCSLLNVNETIYAGTKTGTGKGKLFKSDANNTY